MTTANDRLLGMSYLHLLVTIMALA